MSNSTGYAFFVGIDWADSKHDVAVYSTAKGTNKVFIIEHSTEAIDAFISELLAEAKGAPIAIILEQSKGSLMHALMLRDNVDLYPINPKQFASYRESFRTTKGKSDKNDALLLARLLYERHKQLRVWKPEDENTRLIARLCSRRRVWVEQRTTQGQRLLDLVKSYFPVLLKLAKSKLYDSPLLLEILRKWPDPRRLKRANPELLAKVIASHGVKNQSKLEKIIACLKKAPIHSKDKSLLTVSAIEARYLSKQLTANQELIAQLDQEIKAALAKHPDKELFTSLRGAGNALAPRLLAAFGTDRTRFKNAEEVACYVGVAPVTKQSGKSCLVVRRRACNKYQLQTFHEFASAAAKWCTWSNAYYKMHREKGMKRHAILRKLAYRWIRILFRVWSTRTAFDPERYIRSLLAKCPEIKPFLSA